MGLQSCVGSPFRKVVVKFHDGPRRSVRPIVAVARNGVCVGNDKQFVHVRRIICFPGLNEITTVVGKQRRLKWLATLNWNTKASDPRTTKRKRWKEFHQRRKARKKQLRVPPPPPESHEFVARRLIAASGDPLTYPAILFTANNTRADEFQRLRCVMQLRKHGFSVDPRPLKSVLQILGVEPAVLHMYKVDFRPNGEVGAVPAPWCWDCDDGATWIQPPLRKGYAEAVKRSLVRNMQL